MKKENLTPEQRRIAALWRQQRKSAAEQGRGSLSFAPRKKDAKPVGYKLQNTFEKNLQGVPGGSMSRGTTAATIKMIAAKHTGTKVRSESIGLLRSARNANTTQGSYFTSVVTDETGRVVSDSQGRRVFGR